MKPRGWMNQVQAAWVKAAEKKLGTEADPKDERDVRLLVRLAMKAYGSEVLLKEDAQV